MPSREKGFVHSVVKEEKEFLTLLLELFPENYLSFVENPQDPGEFGSDKIPESIEFPGFIFDSKKEVRWYIDDDMFFATIISDEYIPAFSEVEGDWTREKIEEYMEGNEESNEKGIYLVNPDFSHINIKSKTLDDYLREAKILRNAELFSRNATPIFLTLRRLKQ